MALLNRSDIIPVSQRELADLMRVSNGRIIQATFPGGDIIWRDCPWVVPLLAEWRGLTFNDGAGI